MISALISSTNEPNHQCSYANLLIPCFFQVQTLKYDVP
uniref:Uncharacterized protein n=1 Tax=Rhizophora mucronata TaxID=61149 RepID=A0A2P2QCI2_RHIMU